jgi:SagB-type dehydrogenase family enzyme
VDLQNVRIYIDSRVRFATERNSLSISKDKLKILTLPRKTSSKVGLELFRRQGLRLDEFLKLAPVPWVRSLLNNGCLQISDDGSKRRALTDEILTTYLTPADKRPKKSARAAIQKSVSFPTESSEFIRIKSAVLPYLKTKSVRSFSKSPLSFSDLTNLLRLACAPDLTRMNKRLHPSAGGFYESQIYVSAHNVDSLESGFYFYSERDQKLVGTKISRALLTSLREQAQAAMGSISSPRAVVWIAFDLERMNDPVHRDIAEKLVSMNAGVLLDRFYIASRALDISGCAIGRFSSNTDLHREKALPGKLVVSCGYSI